MTTKANNLNKEGITYSRYANFSLNADYSKTKAKTLVNSFDTSNITLNDTLDLFGKSSYKIDVLALDLKSKKSILNIQKEQLFVSLVNMIALYNKTVEQLSLYKIVLNKQEKIVKKLQKLQQNGAMTSIDLLRFKNQLTALKMKIIKQKNEVVKMKKQLNLYAPKQKIPTLKNAKLRYSKTDFLTKNPQLHLNNTDAQKLMVQAEGLQHSYLPDVTVGVAHQQIGDPTSYGNNYAFTVGLNIPLNAGKFKETQALKVKALSLKSKNIQYQIQRKNEYTTRYQDYISATQQLKVLDENLDDYERSEKNITVAYLQQDIDFNTYMQVILQTLHIKEQILELKYKKVLESTLLNNIASGVIYE